MFAAVSLHAQTSTYVRGTVRDPSGALVPGAKVQITSAAGKPLASTTSDSTGSFQLRVVPGGGVTLTVTRDGFQPSTRSLRLGSGPVPKLTITLSLADVSTTIEVQSGEAAAEVSTDADRNQSAEVFNRGTLDQVPIFDNDYITTLSRFLNPDATGTNGISLVVNGVEANGPGVPPSAIKSVTINQNPYSALFARPGRARLELATEGGTPQLHGSATFLFRDSVFDAKNHFADVKPAERRVYGDASLTGPLDRTARTTFLLGLELDRDDQQSIVFAATPDRIVNANVPFPHLHVFVSGRGFRNYGDGNQFWVGYSYENRSVDNAGVGGTVLPSAGTDTRFFEHEINVQDTHILGKNAVNLLHSLVGQNANDTSSLNTLPQLIVSGSFTGGGAQADLRRTENHFDGTDIVTITHGKQQIKFGIDVPDISRRAFANNTNRQGTYSFSSLGAYAANQPFSYLEQSGPSRVTFVEKTVAGVFEDTVQFTPRLTAVAGLRYYWQNYFHSVGHNLAPRLDLNFAPSSKSHTVLRAGAGLFFDRSGPLPISDLLLFDGNHLQRRLVLHPSYPATGTEISGTPASLITLDPRTIIPHTLQFSFGVEQQVTRSSTVTVNYIGFRGMDLFRSIDANAPLPPTFATRPNTSLGQLRQIQSDGHSKSDAMEITFRGRPVSWFSGQMQYALTKSYNNTAGITYFPAASYAPDSDWARSDNDRRHKFDMLGTAHVSHGFLIGTALSVYSGVPVNVTTGSDNNNDGLALDRPLNTPRNSFHGPGYLDLDLNLSREFALTHAMKNPPTLALTLNGFNVINHTNPTGYVGVVSSPFFGKAVASQPPRRLQLNVQVKF